MVSVCQVCGDRGFTEALIFCDECQIYAVHLYCLAVIPETFDEYVAWLCEDCELKAIKRSSVDKLSTDVESLGSVAVKKRKSVKKFSKKSKRNVNTSSLNKPEILGPEKSSSLQLLAVNCLENIEKVQEYGRRKGLGECSFDKSVESFKSKNSQLNLGDCQPLEMNCSDNGKKDEKVGKDILIDDSLHEKADSVKTKNSLATTTLRANNSEDEEMDKKLGGWNAPESNCYLEEIEKLNDLNKGRFHEELEPLNASAVLSGSSSEALKIDHINDGEKDQNHEEQKNLDEGIFNEEADPSISENNPNVLVQNYVPAQPIEEPIWRGRFSIWDNNICRMLGLFAHLSSLACPKVSEEAKSLPASLSPELLPRSTLWPKGFAKWGPSDDSIALYFFPDSERSEKAFDVLVNDMISKDLGMRAVIQNVELLIFTSTLMPMDFWRFQAKFYLWGVFKAKRPPRAADDAIPGVEKRLIPIMDSTSRSPVSPLANGTYGCGSKSSALSPAIS